MGTGEYLIIMVVAAVLLAIGFLIFLAKRYKRCPSNRILVVYGRTKANRASRCVHGGGTFIIPLIQNYAYLSLDPLQIEIPLSGALSAENIRINVPSVFTVAIGTSEETMNAAAKRLLGLSTTDIAQQRRRWHRDTVRRTAGTARRRREVGPGARVLSPGWVRPFRRCGSQGSGRGALGFPRAWQWPAWLIRGVPPVAYAARTRSEGSMQTSELDIVTLLALVTLRRFSILLW